MKTLSVRAVFFHEDGRTDGYTDLTKQIVSFAILPKRPKGATCTKQAPFLLVSVSDADFLLN
jgi:hypothetical protein